jgi:cyclohexanone monooxygenase
MSGGQAVVKQKDAARQPIVDAEFDVVVVGAGFSGLYLLHRLRELGLRTIALEAADDVGGTWYWNRYPGARCDVQSMTYSYSFADDLQQEWQWTERFARQPEILSYVGHVADRFELREHIRFETRVMSARFDETSDRWHVTTDGEDALDARFLIMATGCLSVPRVPNFAGVDDFEGDWYHTGAWPHHDVDFAGKRVGIIGTGSTAVQAIPKLAQQAGHLTVFQRTPNFSIPAWNGPLDREAERDMKENYSEYRAKARASFGGDIFDANDASALELDECEVVAELERRWRHGGFAILTGFSDILTDETANEFAAEFVRGKIRERVDDPEVAELLCPDDHPFGTKRLCVDSDYYETYNRDNVTLVDVRAAPIQELYAPGLRTEAAEYELDVIIFATGFDAMTGALQEIDIVGRDGVVLSDRWAGGPQTYLGLSVAGFPNMFTITGPGSPSVLSNMMVSIEQHVEWVTDCIGHVIDEGYVTIEATPAAEDEWSAHVLEVGAGTLYPRANSWYTGANIPGKPHVFTPYVGGVGSYRETCDEITADGYRGFDLRTAQADATA